MEVGNIVEKVDLLLGQHQTGSDRVHRRIAPALVKETAILVERLEVVEVSLGAEPSETANFKVGPLERDVSMRCLQIEMKKGNAYKVAFVVGLAAVVAEEAHGVALGNVLWVVLDKLLDAIPESGDGLDVLVQAKNEAVLLVVLVHEAEGVVVDVAEQLDAGLHTPVVVVVEHELLSEEETGLKSAHVAVADAVAIDDLFGSHVLAHLLGLLLVDVRRERPMLLGNQAVVRLARNQRGSNLFKRLIKRLVIEEYPVVVVSPVEAVLDLTDGLCNLPDVTIASQCNKRCVHAGSLCDASEVVESGVIRRHSQGELAWIDIVVDFRLRGLGLGCFVGGVVALVVSCSCL